VTAEALTELYPGRLALLLLKICSPTTAHTHRGTPCLKPGKVPIEREWNSQAVDRFTNGADVGAHLASIAQHLASGGNVGLALPPGVVALDADSPEADAMLDRAAPDAPRQETSRGAHYLFRLPEGVSVSNGVERELAPGIGVDVRAAGLGQIVVEPSRHESDAPYTWKQPLSPSVDELPKLPGWILEKLLKQPPAPRPKRRPERVDVPPIESELLRQTGVPLDPIPEGQRNDRLASIAGTVRRNVDNDPERIVPILLTANSALCKPPLPDAEVEGIARSVSRYGFGEVVGDDPEALQAAIGKMLGYGIEGVVKSGDRYAITDSKGRPAWGGNLLQRASWRGVLLNVHGKVVNVKTDQWPALAQMLRDFAVEEDAGAGDKRGEMIFLLQKFVRQKGARAPQTEREFHAWLANDADECALRYRGNLFFRFETFVEWAERELIGERVAEVWRRLRESGVGEERKFRFRFEDRRIQRATWRVLVPLDTDTEE
jgi:hypothetical protein